ncbi:MAG: DUF202 domain-containing protein [Candidatus Heimdallarchaeota archaeon]|nr:DUF202 domain-containing protein [Candidatus Heimdallarchaeota archaeon]MCK4290816.1 DUF202 domain-containing protein [Candidatus Heimdallarchaeota archaeon]
MPKKQYKVDPEKMIIRDHLAADRTAQANERTFLAYVRTALAFGAGGIGLIKLFEESIPIIVIGWILITISFVVLVFGIIRFIQFRKSISTLVYENQVKSEENNLEG